MKRILLIGSGGAGKTTMALRLGQRLGLPVVHLDQVFWTPGWVHLEQEEFHHRVEKIMEREEWILDGNYVLTLHRRLGHADTVIWLDYPRRLCLLRVLWRWWTLHGRQRPDMAPGCPEKLDREFLRWIWRFPRDVRPEIARTLQAAPDTVMILRLGNPKEARRWLDRVNRSGCRVPDPAPCGCGHRGS